MTTSPGPCPRCGSTNTKTTTLAPPRKHPGRVIPCGPECQQPARLCLNCRLATPLTD